MPINVYSVANHLESEGWKLISTEYKNLDTELEMICPKGHKQIQTYKQWRKYMICDICMAGNIKKVQKNKVPEKTSDTYRILALDAATNTSGYSIYDDGTLVAYGTYKTDNTKDATERINELKYWLIDAIHNWQPDFCQIENIQLQSYNTHGQYQVELYRVLANLQGVIIDTLYEEKIPHDLVYSTEWRKYCNINTDKGRENKKKAAQEKVKQWYNIDCTQDEADAICIGKYACSLNKKTTWGEDI